MESAQKPWYAASFPFIFHIWTGREWRARMKKRGGGANKINLMSFCLLSMCSVCSWMTMTRHPLTTIHILLWINYYVSTQQNKRQLGELIQWNEKPALPDKPLGLARCGMKNDSVCQATDTVAGSTCDNLSVMRPPWWACSSGQSFLHH